MKRRLRIEITTITEQSMGVRLGILAGKGWCESCGSNMPTVTAEQAARLAYVDEQTILQWIDGGQLHRVVAGTTALVCVKSLDHAIGVQ